jgi:hypothetical protein
MSGLFDIRPSHRLGCRNIEGLVSHPWFRDINWADIESKTAHPSFVPGVKPTVTSNALAEEFANYMREEEEKDRLEGCGNITEQGMMFDNFDFIAQEFQDIKASVPSLRAASKLPEPSGMCVSSSCPSLIGHKKLVRNSAYVLTPLAAKHSDSPSTPSHAGHGSSCSGSPALSPLKPSASHHSANVVTSVAHQSSPTGFARLKEFFGGAPHSTAMLAPLAESQHDDCSLYATTDYPRATSVRGNCSAAQYESMRRQMTVSEKQSSPQDSILPMRPQAARSKVTASISAKLG